MLRYALMRLAWMPATLLAITLIVFLALRIAPGDPAQLALSREGSARGELAAFDPAAAAARARQLRAEHLLDRSLAVQYLHFLGPFDCSPRGHPALGGDGMHPYGGLLCLDLGREFHRPSVAIGDELLRRLRVSAPLGLCAALLSALLALPLGVYTAARSGSPAARACSGLLFVLHALPVFWGGCLLVLAFGPAGLDWLPALGLESRDGPASGTFARALELGRHALLPLVALTYGSLAYCARQVRAGVLDALQQDYVRAARAQGLSERRVLLQHALRNALLPAITWMGALVPALIGGSVVVERIFDLPGVGSYVFEGLLERDYQIVQASALLAAVATLLGTLAADLAYAWADPRIRHG